MDPREKMASPHYVVDLLNEAAKLDPQAIRALVDTRVVCNQALADHPTIQVGPASEHDSGGPSVVGLLGILNGIFGTFDDGWGCIAAVIEPGDPDVPISFRLQGPGGKA